MTKRSLIFISMDDVCVTTASTPPNQTWLQQLKLLIPLLTSFFNDAHGSFFSRSSGQFPLGLKQKRGQILEQVTFPWLISLFGRLDQNTYRQHNDTNDIQYNSNIQLDYVLGKI